MKRKRQKPKNSDTRYQTEEYEEVVQIDDNFNPNSNTKQQIENMNELFRKSYANLEEIKSKLENLEHYSSKLCLAGENPDQCPFYHQYNREQYRTVDNNEAYYNVESRPQYTNIPSHSYPEGDTHLDKAEVAVSSDNHLSDLHSNAVPSERIIIDLTPQNEDGSGGVTIKHTSNKYSYYQPHKSVNPPKSYRNPNEATFYTMNDNPQIQTRRQFAHVKQPNYNQHDDVNNYAYSPSSSNKQKKKKSYFLSCCKKR